MNPCKQCGTVHPPKMGECPVKAASTPPSTKPRDFWIATDDEGYQEVWSHRPSDVHGFVYIDHVIEKSAYDQAVAELKTAKQNRAHTICPECGNKGVWNNGVAVLAERDELQRKYDDATKIASGLMKLNARLKQRYASLSDEYDLVVDKLEAIVSYMPKVPTEPYERELAKEVLRLRGYLERILLLAAGELAYTSAFTERSQELAREALGPKA